MTDPDFLARLPPSIQAHARRSQEQMKVAEGALFERLAALGSSATTFDELTASDLDGQQARTLIEASFLEEYNALRAKLAVLIVEAGWCEEHFDDVLTAAIEAGRRHDNAVTSTLAAGLLVVSNTGKERERFERLSAVAADDSLGLVSVALRAALRDLEEKSHNRGS